MLSELMLCLDIGAIFDEHLDQAAIAGSHGNLPILEVLWDSNWRNICNSQDALNELLLRSLYDDTEIMMNWVFDHGAEVTPTIVKKAALSLTIAKTAAIIKRAGIEMFRGSGALQYSVKRGELAKVKLLVESGADVDEIPPSLDVREPGPYSALYEAVAKNRALLAKYLLEQGARSDLPTGPNNETPLRLAKQRNDALMLESFGLEPPGEAQIESGMFLAR